MSDLPGLWIVAAALWLEFFIRWPNAIAHPVVALGAMIGSLDKRWNIETKTESTRRWRGVLALVIVVGCSAGLGLALQIILHQSGLKLAPYLIGALGIFGLAAGSLFQHITDIQRPLIANDLAAARQSVSKVVGRDTHSMAREDVATAALESLAESFNDGVVAPLFWFAIAGLPGLFAYKAVNTADSMIGHMEPRWRAFGWASAKTDDIVNWIPARLAGMLIVLAATICGSGINALRVMLSDASKHASPNAGWPEAAMAGALNIRLGGAVYYEGVLCDRPQFGEGRSASAKDLSRGLKLYLLALGWLTLGLIVGGILWRL